MNSIEYQFNKLREEKEYNIRINNNIVQSGEEYKIHNECNNLVYKGEMVNGKREGQGVQYCPDSGKIIYSGNFKGGYYHGYGLLYETGRVHSSFFPSTAETSQFHNTGPFNQGLFNGQVDRYENKQCGKTVKTCTRLYDNGLPYGSLTQYNGDSSINTDIGPKLIRAVHDNIAISFSDKII